MSNNVIISRYCQNYIALQILHYYLEPRAFLATAKFRFQYVKKGLESQIDKQVKRKMLGWWNKKNSNQIYLAESL